MHILLHIFRKIFITTLSIILAFFILFACIFVFVSKDVQIKKYYSKPNGILHLKLKGNVTDYSPGDIMAPKKQNTNLNIVLSTIQYAMHDKNILGIYLSMEDISIGWAQLEEIGKCLSKFKKSGKPIITYSTFYDNKTYYLAAVSDTIIAHEEGIFLLNGLSSTVYFYQKLLQYMSIEPLVFRAGNFKSAIEPFTRTSMSEESRAQKKQWMNSIYQHFLCFLVKNRDINKTVLHHAIDNLSLSAISDAKAHSLVEVIVKGDKESKSLVKNKIQQLSSIKDKPYFVDYERYYTFYKQKKKSKNKIAVVVAQGDIISGKSTAVSIGDKSMEKLLKKLGKDKSIKGVVLRIDSPGGSSQASNNIWNAILRLKTKKPVVSSMGNVAASGGYYMAMAADHIVANATSITGSIGVFALWLNPHQFIKDRMKISSDVVKTNPSADMFHNSRTMTLHERNQVQKYVDVSYQSFIDKVANMRKIPIERVKKIASGRVWVGIDAQKHGLVDTIGGLYESIEQAKKQCNLEQNYSIVYYSPKQSWIEKLLEFDIKNFITTSLVPKSIFIAKEYQTLERMQGIQARIHDSDL